MKLSFVVTYFLFQFILVNKGFCQNNTELYSKTNLRSFPTRYFHNKDEIRREASNSNITKESLFFLLEDKTLSTWYIDTQDTISMDDNAMCLVTEYKVRIKRNFGDYIDPSWFGLVQGSLIDNSTPIQNAIDFALKSKINKVRLPSGTYYVQNLKIKSGLILEGSNLNGFSTILKRLNSNSILCAEGSSVLSQHPEPITNFFLSNLQFHSNDIKSEKPMVLLKVAYNFKLQNCKFTGKGYQLLLWEVFDSIVERCRFEWGGNNEDANSSSLEIASTNRSSSGKESLEYSNNIYFNDCVFESHFSRAIKFTGNNTNEIYFKNLKIESKNNTIFENIYIQNATNIQFENCQITSTLNLSSQIKIKNSNLIKGEIFLEFFPSSAGTYSQSLIDVDNLEGSKLDLYFYKLPKLVIYTGNVLKTSKNIKNSKINVNYPFNDSNYGNFQKQSSK